MLKLHAPWLKCAFFNGTDGKVDEIPDNEVARTWNTKHNALYGAYEDVFDKPTGKLLHSAADFENPGVEYTFSPGERGCAHSHYRIWRQVAEGDHPILVIEDDVQLVFERTCGGMSNGVSFSAKLEESLLEAEGKDADVLYLGWSGFRDGNYKYHTTSKGNKKGSIIRRAEYVWTTVAYVLWPRGAQKLLDAAQPMDQPVDNFMAWECREGRLEAYVVLDDGDDDGTWSGGIVTQFDFANDSDVRKSDGGDQGHDPTEYLAHSNDTTEDAPQAMDKEPQEMEGQEDDAPEQDAEEEEEGQDDDVYEQEEDSTYPPKVVDEDGFHGEISHGMQEDAD